MNLIFFLSLSNTWRTTNEEKRYLERENQDHYNDLRKAAEVHRQVFMQPKFGMMLPHNVKQWLPPLLYSPIRCVNMLERPLSLE